MFIDMRRRTGRTTRMMEEAVRLAKDGRAVYVVAASMRHADLLERQFADRIYGLGIKIEAANNLPTLDWDTITIQGSHPNCRVLVDHYAIEVRFAQVLSELHRFDDSNAGAPAPLGGGENRMP